MVRLFRGVRGRGVPRPPMMPRHMRNHDYEPHFLTPYDMPRGRMLRGHPGRLGPPIPPLPPLPRPPRGMVPPPLPPLPIPPPHLHPRDLPLPLSRRLRDIPIPIGLPHPRDMPIPFRGMPIPVPRELPPFHLRGRPPGMPPPMPPGPPIMPDLRVKKKKKRAPVNGLQKYLQKVRRRKEKDEAIELSKPWVTEALKTEIIKKHQLYKSAKEKKTETSWGAYIDQRVLVGKMTYSAKLEYIGSHPEADVKHIMFGAAPV